jgi:hypothetical protein
MSPIGRAKIQCMTSVDVTVEYTWKILHNFIVLKIPLNSSNAIFPQASGLWCVHTENLNNNLGGKTELAGLRLKGILKIHI